MKKMGAFDVNHYLVQDALTDLFKFVEDIEMCTNKYLENDKEDRLVQLAASQALNNFVQCFKDIVDSCCSNMHGTDITLRAYIRAFYSLNCAISNDAENILDYLVIRNDIAHEYFRFDSLASENIAKFISYKTGFREIAETLRDYAVKSEILKERVR